jgi:hypothetical protein
MASGCRLRWFFAALELLWDSDRRAILSFYEKLRPLQGGVIWPGPKRGCGLDW